MKLLNTVSLYSHFKTLMENSANYYFIVRLQINKYMINSAIE